MNSVIINGKEYIPKENDWTKLLQMKIGYLKDELEVKDAEIQDMKDQFYSECNLNWLESFVLLWASARRIIPNAKPESQVLKAVSEMGELADAVLKGQDDEMKDAIGDVVVCLINLCALTGTSLGECLKLAYEQIKDRKGTLLENGCFVKEEAK